MADDKKPNNPWGGKGGKKPGGNANSPWGRPGPRPVNTRPDMKGPKPKDTSSDLENIISGFKSRRGSGGGRKGGGGGRGDIPSLNPLLLLAVAGAFWLATTSFYTVDDTEDALVFRFGDYNRIDTEGGLKFKLPAPIETVTKARTSVQTEIIGGNDATSLMLTGDENIVDIDFKVFWKVANLRDYIIEVDDPQEAVRAVAESAMREVVGREDLTDIITVGRTRVEGEVMELIQITLDEYKAGVNIEQIVIEKADAPDQGNVVDAFREVVDAQQEAETMINQATGYRNDIVPRARGDAARILQAAEGYRDSVIAEAEGEAERFNLIYSEYRQAPRVTRQRMYLETIEELYEDSDKIVLDNNAGSGVVPYLPLDQLGKKAGGN